MTEILDNFYAIRVTDDADHVFIGELDAEENLWQLNYTCQNLDEDSGFYGDWGEAAINLPPGTYSFLFLSSNATEEDCRGIMKKDGRHEWWCVERNGGAAFYDNAIEPFRLMLKLADLKGNHAIIKKEK